MYRIVSFQQVISGYQYLKHVIFSASITGREKAEGELLLPFSYESVVGLNVTYILDSEVLYLAAV